MIKTNNGLVEYAMAQLGRPYWYGTFGQNGTQALLSDKTKQYPSHYIPARIPKYKTQFGERVHDCVGLIKGYLWSSGPNAVPKYNASQDVSANGMRDSCKEKGTFSTMPDIPGILVFSDGHTGVYIGSGYVVEARGFNYGVVKTPLNSRGWTSWGKCPWITYTVNKSYFKKYGGSSVSIVDALAAIGVQHSFAYRKQIAAANGIENYSGTPEQNTKLLLLLKNGELVKP